MKQEIRNYRKRLRSVQERNHPVFCPIVSDERQLVGRRIEEELMVGEASTESTRSLSDTRSYYARGVLVSQPLLEEIERACEYLYAPHGTLNE